MFFRLRLDMPGGDTRTWELGTRPIYVGRAAGNDVMLDEASVSARHAVVWEVGGQVFVEDLRTKNGTSCAGARIRGVTRAAAGDEIRIGGHRFVVDGDPSPSTSGAVVPCLEDLAAGVAIPFRKDRVRIGAAPGAELVLPDGPAEAAVLLVDPDGLVWLGTDGESRVVAVGEAFEVQGRPFRLSAVPTDVTRTADLAVATYPYTITARLLPDGADAQVVDSAAGRAVRFQSDNRAMLVFLLALKVKGDVGGGVPAPDAGWYHDEDLGDAIWGRPGRAALVNNLHVLVCRTRRELRDAGFDPWFIEKRNRHTRARVAGVDVTGERKAPV